MKITRFWKIYILSVAVALGVVAVGLGVFYGFIASYERSQPEYAAQMYADSLTDKKISELVIGSLPETLSPYESPELLCAFYMDKLDDLEGSLSVRKDYKNYTSQTPVFNIVKDSVFIASISLEEGNSGAFGMKRWEISTASALPENWTSAPQRYTFYVPLGATISINGIRVPEESIIDANIPYAHTSIYEPHSTARWNVYMLEDLRAVPIVTCSLASLPCPAEKNGNSFFIKYPESASVTYTVTAPEGATVSVNGVQVTDKSITEKGIPYDYPHLEENLSGLPTAVTYTLAGLFDEPDIKATFGDTDLVFTQEGSAYTAGYPTNLLYTCVLKVPASSQVKIRGIDCASYVTGQETAYTALSAHISSLPVFDVYTIPGLYISPAEAISVTLNGEALPVSTRTDGYNITAHAGFAVVDNKEINDRALAFVKDYITYTGQGYNNLDANLQRVLSYVLPYTEVYSRIANSRIGIYYVTPVTANEYKKLTTSSIIQYSENLYECTVDFEVIQNTYHVQNDYTGQIQLLLVRKNGTWKVADMLIDSK